MYGITETTVHVTHRALKHEDLHLSGASPIGTRIDDLRIYMLDGHLSPVPLGVAGELYIGGAGVARGYLNRPELTSERFIASPFVAGDRLYKTGDLARYLPDGNIEFLGRNDFQVKIRGFRIELGEIESRLSQYPGVREAVVLAREDVPGDKRLVAYYTTGGATEALGAEALKAYLSLHLPEYMVPAAYVVLDSLPLTPNGKLDRQALPAPEDDAYGARIYEAPQGPVETAIAAIWSDVLGLERIGRQDNFFDLGGHSLLAIKVLSKVRELHLRLDLQDFFAEPSLKDLCKKIQSDVEAFPDDHDLIALSTAEYISGLSDEDVLQALREFEND
jgi:arthrofactin-type cyclic lipopeptide synthetase C